MTATEEKRLFIGGLVKAVTEDELVEKFSRFGQVSSVEIKTRTSETDSKIFAYLNLTAEDNSFKKCFTAYNNSKWKGGQLKLQFAKESSLSKLRKEQAEAKMAQERKETKPASAVKSPVLKGTKKAVPGTPLDEKGTWVMGKFSLIQPVLRLKTPGSGKIVTVDPSKMTHNLKRLKCDDFDPKLPVDLTWQLEENTSDINKRRQGQFPAWEAPRHQSTPKVPGSLFSRLQGLASEKPVADTEMEVVPVGKMETVSKTRAPSGGLYDSDDSAGSADTDEIVCKASGKKTPKVMAANCVTAAEARTKKRKKTPVKSSPLSGRDDDGSACSSGIPTPSSKSSGKKTSDSLHNGKESRVKNKLHAKNAKTEEKQKPQFEFVRFPKLKGKALKKSAKLSHSETPSAGNRFSDEESQVKVPRTSGKKLPANRTPEFKGLGMLSSDSEDDVPPTRSAEKGKSKGQSRAKTTAAVKGAKAHSSLQKTWEKDVSSDSDNTDDILTGDKENSVTTQKSLKEKCRKESDSSKEHRETKVTKSVSHAQLQKNQQKKAVKNSRGTENQNGKTKPVVMRGASISELTDEFGDGLETDTSLPTLQRKRKRSRPDSSDDSDLDDNDFEKVGRKLAARAYRTDQASTKTVQNRHQEDSKKTARRQQEDTRTARRHQEDTKKTPDDTANTTRKRTSQGEGGSLTAMQRSHQVYSKVLKKKKEKESLITKALRNEGIESKRIKFSDSENEEMPSEVKPAKMSLFSDSDADSDSGSEVDFSLRPQFEGSKGKKLFELQSKIMDPRFRLGELFQTDSEGEEGGESNAVEQDSEDELARERQKQLQILEKILGYKPRQRRPVYVPMSQRRYGPDTAAALTIVPKAKPEKGAMKKRKCDHDTAAEVRVVSAAKPEKRQRIENKKEEAVEASTNRLKALFSGGTSFTFFGSSDDEDDVDEPVASSHVEKDEDDAEEDEEEDTEEGEKEDAEEDEEEDAEEEDTEEDEEEDADEDEEEDAEEDEEEDAEEDEEEDTEEDEEEDTEEDEGEDEEEDAEEDEEEDAEEEDAEEEDEERGSEDTACAVNRARVPETDLHGPPIHPQPSFMVTRDDPRLIAAAKFFKRPSEEEFEELKKRWPEERRRIMALVDERHKRALRKQRMMKFKGNNVWHDAIQRKT